MGKIIKIEALLRSYKLNKSRITFLENQIKKLSPESYGDYIKHRMYEHGHPEEVPGFIMENGLEVAKLNIVEYAAFECHREREKGYKNTYTEIENELKELKLKLHLLKIELKLLID